MEQKGVDLTGKTAIVTGAGSGVGRELARTFARAGANVACAGRRLERLEETVAMIAGEGGTGIAVRCDVAEWDDVQRLAQTTLDRFGQVDLLFNNAGIVSYVGPMWEADLDIWWHDVKINLLGTMMCCKAVLPHMIARDQGVIFTMDGGGGATGPLPGGSSYGSGKAAIVRFTEGLAAELAQVGSSVLAFCMNPGFVRSAMTEFLIETPEHIRWMPQVYDALGSDLEVPADACARATMKLLAIAGPDLSGRCFSQEADFEDIAHNRDRIKAENLYVLRWVML